jgi:hypothetical protein
MGTGMICGWRAPTDIDWSIKMRIIQNDTYRMYTAAGRRFRTVEEMGEHSIRDLRGIPQNTFQDAFQNWEKKLGAVWRGVL